MIRKVVIRRFKRFAEVEFDLPGHVVLAGPNNTGKTTMLQAVAAWGLAFRRWKELNDFQRHGGVYTKAPIARHAFSAVPLRAFDLLWKEREYSGSIEIVVQTDDWTIPMELIADSTEQIYVRPRGVDPDVLRGATLATVFVPPMSGLSTEEPVYQRPKLDQLLGLAKPGDMLRNLLVEASQSEAAWPALLESITRLFRFELLVPDASGANILAEYRAGQGGPKLDIASAGSGFQQVLMLLALLNTRPASVMLLDEPDAHLHVILQDAIYGELRAVAARQKSQLIIATHSEVIINAVEPRELCVMLNQPRLLADSEERTRLIKSLGALSNEDIMLALDAPGVLYLEDYTDLEILRAWASVLHHPAQELLTTRLFWKKTSHQARPGARGILARDHYEALTLARPGLPGLELVDGDARAEIAATDITGTGLQRLRWRRYEIESYLIHPAALERFVEQQVGPEPHSSEAKKALREYLERVLTLDFVKDPFGDHPLVEAYLEKRKARTEVIPPILAAAGLPGFDYRRFHEIAAVMKPEEIHPEVVEKLNGIMRAFGL